MRGLALIAALAVMGHGATAVADDEAWIKLQPGEVKVIEDAGKVPPLARAAAGYAPDEIISRVISFTFFKAPHGRELVVVNPCCGEKGNGASLFEYTQGVTKSVELSLGDPREGFIAQAHADMIHVEPAAKALSARIGLADCEDGVWSYYYQFDDADRPVLLSVIDTSCEHLGVRELYRAKNSVLGHWWMK